MPNKGESRTKNLCEERQAIIFNGAIGLHPGCTLFGADLGS